VFRKEFPEYQPFPFGVQRHIAQLVRHILLSEPLVGQGAERFRGCTAEDIEGLMQSFRFESCAQRTELADTLRTYA
jgi:endoglucanase